VNVLWDGVAPVKGNEEGFRLTAALNEKSKPLLPESLICSRGKNAE
jgi:hypothetical protein